MKFLETHELVISTLSPVHIGCGEDYEPTNYVVDDKGTLHELDSLAALCAGGEKLRRQLESALSAGDPRSQMRGIHNALKNHAKFLTPAALSRVPLAPGVLAHYRDTQDPRHDFNRNGIERTAYTGVERSPIIPGSSLKGAMRTAWLCHVGGGSSPIDLNLKERIKAFNDMIEAVETRPGSEQWTWKLKDNHEIHNYKNALKDIEKALSKAAAGFEKVWLGGSFESDPLRALKIGDAMPCVDRVEREVRFCINRSRSGRKTQAQTSKLYTRLEYVVEHQPAAFRLNISLHELTSIAGRRNRRDELIAPRDDRLVDWPQLIRACNDYYLPRLEADLHVLALIKPDSLWLTATQKALNAGLRDDIREYRAILLRVGKHSGADSNTVDGRQIKIMLNEDRREREINGNNREVKFRLWAYDSAPRTTWFCADDLDDPSDLMPHGWIVLSLPDLPWMTSLPGHARRQERLFQEAKARTRAAEAEEAARREAEATARRAAALAALTENQRRIETFIESCRKRAEQLGSGRDRQNTTLHNEARALVKAAQDGANWTAEEKRALADAIESWLPKLIERMDAKEVRKQLKLAALRA